MQAKIPRPWRERRSRSPVGPGKLPRHEIRARPRAYVAAEIDRLAELGQRVRQGPPALAHDERHQLGMVRLEEIGGAFQSLRPAPGAGRVPKRRRARGARQRLLDMGRFRLDDSADCLLAVGGIGDGPARAGERHAADDRRRGRRLRRRLPHCRKRARPAQAGR